MRILLTNDDGAGSPGITLLAGALRDAGHKVVMVAPSSNCSGASHSISFFKGTRKFAEIGRDSYSFDGTPADCVLVALRGGLPEMDTTSGGKAPDAVVSGINKGANLGTDIVFSGTAAAARQGAFYGIPSLALSLVHMGNWERETWHWDDAVAFSVERLEEMLARWKPDSFLNVNLPNLGVKPLGLERAFPCARVYKDRIDVGVGEDGQTYCSADLNEPGARLEEGSDWNAIVANRASLSEIFIHPALLEDVRRRQ